LPQAGVTPDDCLERPHRLAEKLDGVAEVSLRQQRFQVLPRRHLVGEEAAGRLGQVRVAGDRRRCRIPRLAEDFAARWLWGRSGRRVSGRRWHRRFRRRRR
jgi:hypothetical protein